MNSDKPRFQFSLRDLLVLTTAAGVGLCLLVLAIESSRNSTISGRNAQCKNNLRNLAMATDSYQSSAGIYPGRTQTLAGRPVPWAVALLPNLERLDLYSDWANPSIAIKPPPYFELLTCPQDFRSRSSPHLSYVVNAGIADLTNGNPANGLFFDLTSANPTTITGEYLAGHDGQSHTLIFTENLQATTWDSTKPYETIFVWHPTTQPTKAMLMNGGNLQSVVTAAMARPASNHPDGVNVAFADTHVKFINDQIEYRIYIQLMTPSDADSDLPAVWRNRPLVESDLR